jgi:hypothetical protein
MDRTFSIHLAVALYLGIFYTKNNYSAERIKSCAKLPLEKENEAKRKNEISKG